MNWPWPLWVLAALCPSLLLAACAQIGIVRDRRRRSRRVAMQRHPAVIGRQLREQRVIADCERDFAGHGG